MTTKPTTPRPSAEQVNAALIYTGVVDGDRSSALDTVFIWHVDTHGFSKQQSLDQSVAQILAAELAWSRWELAEARNAKEEAK